MAYEKERKVSAALAIRNYTTLRVRPESNASKLEGKPQVRGIADDYLGDWKSVAPCVSRILET